jgi:hypothetical protein
MVREVTIFNGFETDTVNTQINNIHTEEGVVWGTVQWRDREVLVRNNGPNGWSGRTT